MHKSTSSNTTMIEESIRSTLREARIPGAAMAIVAGGEVIFAGGFGLRDLAKKLPMRADTRYPIGSTTKAMSATLLGLLVEEGKLQWDRPVTDYLPAFRLHDVLGHAEVTVRDLVLMRAGLPRHDWSWSENPTSRAALVERLRYLEPSARLREKFQYNNLTPIAAGHIAEVVSGKNWERLVEQRLLRPLGMRNTHAASSRSSAGTSAYHENSQRNLQRTTRSDTRVAAPAGGVIESTVLDMAKWVSFNLQAGRVGKRQLIQPRTLAEIHTPQILTGADGTAPTPNCGYAMGWYCDTYRGYSRLVHGGYIHDIHSDVMLFPKEGIGFVAFTNFGAPLRARVLSEQAFDLLMGMKPTCSIAEKLAVYERNIADTRKSNAGVRRVAGTRPSHSLRDYAGEYFNPGYGAFEIHAVRRQLRFKRHELSFPLSHWHFDTWVAKEEGQFPIHALHTFSSSYPLSFETSPDGSIVAASICLEPAVAPIRFIKRSKNL